MNNHTMTIAQTGLQTLKQNVFLYVWQITFVKALNIARKQLMFNEVNKEITRKNEEKRKEIKRFQIPHNFSGGISHKSVF